jgi:hypothetical protein
MERMSRDLTDFFPFPSDIRMFSFFDVQGKADGSGGMSRAAERALNTPSSSRQSSSSFPTLGSTVGGSDYDSDADPSFRPSDTRGNDDFSSRRRSDTGSITVEPTLYSDATRTYMPWCT